MVVWSTETEAQEGPGSAGEGRATGVDDEVPARDRTQYTIPERITIMSAETLPALVDPDTGEDHPQTLSHDVSFPPAPRPEVVAGASSQPISEGQWVILNKPVEPQELDVKPDSSGAVYIGHIHIRRRLNAAFRPGGWALVPVTDARYDPDSKVMVQWWDLCINGQFASRALGGQRYTGDDGDSQTTFDDAVEGAKSNALMRCCKDLGIASECWDRAFTEAWRAEHCVRVWVDGKKRPQWRRIDAPPFYKENGVTDDSPNRDKYVSVKHGKPAQKPNDGTTAKPKSSTQEAPTNADACISDKQAKRLWAISREIGIDDDDVVAELKKRGYNKSYEIKKSDYEDIIKWVQDQKDGPDVTNDDIAF